MLEISSRNLQAIRGSSPEALLAPAQTPEEPPQHPEEVSRHTYYRDGQAVMLVLRLKHDEEERYYRDLRKGGDQWLRKKPDYFNPPHYNHDALMDEELKAETIFFVETETQADALMRHGILATTFGSPGAYQSYETIVLRNRNLIALGSNTELGSLQAFNINLAYGDVTRSVSSLSISSPISRTTEIGYTILDWLRDIGPVDDVKERLLQFCYSGWPVTLETPSSSDKQPIELIPPAPSYRFNVQTPHLGMAKPQMRWILDGILPATGTAILYGEGGVGKSFLASAIAFAIQNGKDFGGRTTMQGEVIYFAVEDGDGMMRRTLEAIERDPTLRPYGLIARELDLSSTSTDPDMLIEDLHQQFEGRQIRLIIIDTLQMALGRAEESAATDATAIMRNCNRISDRLGCLVLLIHHCGKEASRGHRGSSAFQGAATTMLKMTGSDSSASVVIEKQKHGPRGIGLNLHLEGSDDDRICTVILDGEWASSKQNGKLKNTGISELEAAILSILEQHVDDTGKQKMSRADLRHHTDSLPCLLGKGEQAIKSQVNRAITELQKRGSITSDRTSITLTGDSTAELED
jgi:hypothetical protein